MKERIKALRKTLGLTQQEFADRVGLKEILSQIMNWPKYADGLLL